MSVCPCATSLSSASINLNLSGSDLQAVLTALSLSQYSSTLFKSLAFV